MTNIVRRNPAALSSPAALEWEPLRVMRDFMRWDPFRELWPVGERRTNFAPASEVCETGDTYVFRLDLPGVEESNLDVSLAGNRLTITGHRDATPPQDGETRYCDELNYGEFTRSFTIPDEVSGEVQADLRHGVLTITIPKVPEQKARHIPVRGEPLAATPRG